MERLFIADEEGIRSGYTMDVYFERTRRILEAKGLTGTRVWAEFTAGRLPNGWPWAVFCGLEEVLRLMEGRPVDISAVPEGTVFRARSHNSVRIPLMGVHGAYADFGVMETAMLGMVCQPSGVATQAARIKIAAGGKPVFAFGNRRMHPAISGVLDRSAYIGGCDAVSSRIGGDITGSEPLGTTPHALMLMMGGNDAAFRAFDEVIEPEVPRIMLIDTFSDERTGAMDACRAIGGKLKGVRLDTPGSRRGNFKELIDEVRWELDMNGFKDVGITATGGLDEASVAEIADHVSSFGVGTSIANAPTLDMSMDLVERDGVPISKRGKFGGRKYAYRCPDCLAMDTSLSAHDDIKCACGARMELLERTVMEGGRRTAPERSASEIRGYVLSQLRQIGELRRLRSRRPEGGRRGAGDPPPFPLEKGRPPGLYG